MTSAQPSASRSKRSRRAGWALASLIILALTAGPSPSGHAQSTHPQSGSGDALQLGPFAILAKAPSVLDLGAGVYDLIGNAHRNETGAVGAEFRYGRRFFGIGPAVGVIANARGGGMGYVGLATDLSLGPIILTPLAGAGAWWRGSNNDENLGGTFEFRLSLTAAYAFANGSRLGLRFGHISNADLHVQNPGENDVMLTYALPLGF